MLIIYMKSSPLCDVDNGGILDSISIYGRQKVHCDHCDECVTSSMNGSVRVSLIHCSRIFDSLKIEMEVHLPFTPLYHHCTMGQSLDPTYPLFPTFAFLGFVLSLLPTLVAHLRMEFWYLRLHDMDRLIVSRWFCQLDCLEWQP
jgi:hypothetical protein